MGWVLVDLEWVLVDLEWVLVDLEWVLVDLEWDLVDLEWDPVDLGWDPVDLEWVLQANFGIRITTSALVQVPIWDQCRHLEPTNQDHHILAKVDTDIVPTPLMDQFPYMVCLRHPHLIPHLQLHHHHQILATFHKVHHLLPSP
jgi:hypothetical protein